jgi:hypothetical protein
MSTTQELFDQMKGLMGELEANHTDAVNGNKAAGRRARKAAGGIKKLATPYKQASVTELS